VFFFKSGFQIIDANINLANDSWLKKSNKLIAAVVVDKNNSFPQTGHLKRNQ
jgi:hypothetical protein